MLNLTVRSLSSLSASYELSLNCSEAIKNVSSQTVSIAAKSVVNVSFNIYSESSLRGNHSCVAFLLSSTGKELHKVDVKFSTEATVFQSSLPSSVPQLETTEFPLTLKTDEQKNEVLCEQLCLNTANVFCKLVNVNESDAGLLALLPKLPHFLFRVLPAAADLLLRLHLLLRAQEVLQEVQESRRVGVQDPLLSLAVQEDRKGRRRRNGR